MSEILMRLPQSTRLKNRRIAVALALITLLYIAAVIVFIIAY
jgi:hypothetical protein